MGGGRCKKSVEAKAAKTPTKKPPLKRAVGG